MATREQRIRRRLFDDAPTYDTDRGRFAPLPSILRGLQFLFTPRAWQVYCYILMRAGPAGIAWFEVRELAYDLGFGSISKLRPYVRELVDGGWILTASSRGKHYYLPVDPLVVLERLRTSGQLSDERLEHVEDLLETLKLDLPTRTNKEAASA